MALTLLVGTPALTFIGVIGAALAVALRRGGLLLAVLVLPLTVPVLIFGVSASKAAIVGAAAVRHAVHDSVRAVAGQPRGRHRLPPRRRSAAWNGVTRMRECLFYIRHTRPPHPYKRPWPIIDLANPSRFLVVHRAHAAVARRAATVLAFAVRHLSASAARRTTTSRARRAKIMFIHVPAAWLSMGGWTVMSLAALGTLVWRHPLADVSAKAAAPIGAAFTFICLDDRNAVGPPDVGHLLGVGRAADVGARAPS